MLFICGTAICVALALIVLTVALFPVRYHDKVKMYCEEFGVPPEEVYAVIWCESKFDKNAVSSAGACGLMQLLPSTAQWLSKQLGAEYSPDMLFDPDYNIRLGTMYLAYLKQNFSGDYAFAAYNAGEGNVRKWLLSGGKIEFEETRKYIKRIKTVKTLYSLRV